MKLRLATASLNQTSLDWSGNRKRIEAAITEAKNKDARVLLLPELAVSGYGCEDQFLSENTALKSLEIVRSLLPLTAEIAVVVGLPVRLHSGSYIGAAVLSDKKIKGIYLKQNLANYGLHYEPRWFKPWKAGEVSSLKTLEEEIPVGDLIFEYLGFRFGVELCHDAWVEERPAKLRENDSLSLVLNPSASHFAFGKYEFVRNLILDSTKEFEVAYAYANLLGNEAGRVIYDGKGVIASGGEIIGEHPRFSMKDSVSMVCDVEVPEKNLEVVKSGRLVSLPGEKLNGLSEKPVEELHENVSSEKPLLSKEEEFSRAVSLGLFDYLRKSRAKGFVISLSGGADSSACAVLVSQMLSLGLAELGAKKFLERLGIVETVKGDTKEEILYQILTLVYQSTSSSSDSTRDSARTLAEGLGAPFHELDIEPVVTAYRELVSAALDYQPSWEQDDISLQNIQARVRAPGIWFFANLKQALLLATCNRSEAAVGYTTMDGDTCGGLSPIGGIDKAYLRQWLRWAEVSGPDGVGPTPSLARMNSLEPTAELRPGGEQLDEAELMPYPVLDAIERLAIRDKLEPLQTWKTIASKDSAEGLASYSKKQLGLWTKRFYTLWCQSQWKRERYAPSFHLDDESLCPKTWCRFPILSSGFKEELEDLDKELVDL